MTVAKKQKKSGSGFLAGLIIGVAIGATVVWVLTPQPREIEAMQAARAAHTPGAGADDMSASGDAAGANGADGAAPTVVDLAMAVVERVRARFGDAMALGREAYAQGQTEVMQRFNQARSAE
ncbi:MAG TPA: hypothetical protein VIC85_18605 [Ktedonobacterales bacterium]